MKIKKHKHWVVLFSAVALLSLNHYLPHSAVNSLFFYFALPFSIIILFFNEKLGQYGFQLGVKRKVLVYTITGVAVSIVATLFSSRLFAGLRAYYQVYSFNLFFVFEIALYMIGWEFLFRGYLLFGLKEHFNELTANLVQSIIFLFVHFGKPWVEVIASFFGGLLFGQITLKSKSVLPMIIIHSAIMTSLVLFTNL